VGDAVQINLLPDQNAEEWLLSKKRNGSRAALKNILGELLPARFAEAFVEQFFKDQITLYEMSESQIKTLSKELHAWSVFPKSTVGYNKAEVTRGGVCTSELAADTMEAKKVPGLFFIGEVVDVTGWLGGYNFQWAWSSGWAAAQAL
jgi:predicted Rossmann fold flavoprotein